MPTPRTRLASTVLDSADPRRLAAFYERLLGWTIAVSEPARPESPPEDGWVILRSGSGDTALSFQYEPNYSPPVWPSVPDAPLMMVHLDIAVDDLDAAVEWAGELGATPADHQPKDDVRVMLDPAGHPFCLFEGRV
ncbi:MAG TPA: VOC family protein [Ilumatobacteraceae bacterium]|jgi:catechol 2,3-dioxygenase-like lactoylglutathione lyase family enzyme